MSHLKSGTYNILLVYSYSPYSMATTIERCFHEIDQLQHSAYDIIGSISNAEYFEDSEENPEGARSAKVKEANNFIRQIPELLCVVNVSLQNCSQPESKLSYFQEKYELYRLIEPNLKEDLKKAQLEAYKKENQVIHQQRLTKYNCKAEMKESGKSTDLFAGRSQKSQASKDGTCVEDQITTHNKNITSSLKQTRQLMNMSVMQTELNIDSLDQQYKDLHTFNSKMVDMESILLKSRQIVKFIERQDRNDKKRIYLAIGFLILCSAWVLWRRVLKTPFRIFMWTILKTFGFVNWITATVHSSELKSVVDSSSIANSFGSSQAMSSVISVSTPTTSHQHYVQELENILSVLTWEDNQVESLQETLLTVLTSSEVSTTTLLLSNEKTFETSKPVDVSNYNVGNIGSDESMNVERNQHETDIVTESETNYQTKGQSSNTETPTRLETPQGLTSESRVETSALVVADPHKQSGLTIDESDQKIIEAVPTTTSNPNVLGEQDLRLLIEPVKISLSEPVVVLEILEEFVEPVVEPERPKTNDNVEEVVDNNFIPAPKVVAEEESHEIVGLRKDVQYESLNNL